MSVAVVRAPPSPDRVARTGARLKERVAERVIGLEEVTEQVLIALFTRSHALLEGVPGLAKTLLLSTIARLMDLSFARIQFTPDLMPSDITGSEYLVQDAATGQREFKFASGPIFTNVVLADEINRAPPKTQAALIEAMEERQVTTLGVTRKLDEPFLVLATQNPLELQGTYPLPAAQLDRFLFKVRLEYPPYADEERIARLVSLPDEVPPDPVLSKEELLAIREEIAEVPVPRETVRWAVELAHASRPGSTTVSEVKDYVEWGVGPRAAQGLVVAAKARALLRGRRAPDGEDLAALAPAVFRHRLILSYAAEADGIGPDDIVRTLLDRLPPPGVTVRPTRRPWWGRLLGLLVSGRPGEARRP